MKHFTLKYLLLAGLPFMAACNNSDDALQEVQPLQLCVSAGMSESRAVVDGHFLPEGAQIGVSLVDAEGNAYDGQDYTNVPYTVTGDGYNVQQTWACTGNVTPSLSTTFGKAVAYYPYNPDVTDLTSIPVETASQTDYMYSGWCNYLYYASPKADLSMNHAMAVVMAQIPKETIGAYNQVVSMQVTADCFGSSAILNATDGSLSSIAGLGTPIKIMADDGLVITEDEDFIFVQMLVIPDNSVNSGADIDVLVELTDGVTISLSHNTLNVSKSFVSGKKYVCRMQGLPG